MSAQHTPGPWHWPNDGAALRPTDPRPNDSAVHTILVAGGELGFLGSNPQDTLAEIEANRRLIAAAPDLHEAAAYALEVLNYNRGKQARLRAIQRLQAALAKADGGAA